ncbi:hypothetical protein GWO13_00975, partial [Candidatus Bathyarchaeota archaeon]|nr:hypothetical protein [Candidatus Bathyarchaeota archaeon]NIU82340.1 hypothetical protein [Candidatus Thorarchaeota archaeon]NIW12826.1 hypothetical protein [Candidatus Thorarchaeota archaeon]NIW51017.1 hypothetical protein [Candidatus Korarchaeota archaeon]
MGSRANTTDEGSEHPSSVTENPQARSEPVRPVRPVLGGYGGTGSTPTPTNSEIDRALAARRERLNKAAQEQDLFKEIWDDVKPKEELPTQELSTEELPDRTLNVVKTEEVKKERAPRNSSKKTDCSPESAISRISRSSKTSNRPVFDPKQFGEVLAEQLIKLRPKSPAPPQKIPLLENLTPEHVISFTSNYTSFKESHAVAGHAVTIFPYIDGTLKRDLMNLYSADTEEKILMELGKIIKDYEQDKYDNADQIIERDLKWPTDEEEPTMLRKINQFMTQIKKLTARHDLKTNKQAAK